MIEEQMIHSNSSAPILPMQCYKQPFVELYNEDCLETLKRLPTGSVDLMLQDPPYGVTACDWDKTPFWAEMWLEWERVLKPNGVWAFTATQPFATDLIMSRRGFFKHEMIWVKNKYTNFLAAKKMPMRNHENVLFFYREQPDYYPQKRKVLARGKTDNTKTTKIHNITGKATENYDNRRAADGMGMPGSVLEFDYEADAFNSSNGSTNRHPSQKPINLFRWIIKSYTKEGDIVFDGYSGSGTTAAACLKEKRRFIGSELSKEYFELSVKRLEEIRAKPELF